MSLSQFEKIVIVLTLQNIKLKISLHIDIMKTVQPIEFLLGISCKRGLFCLFALCFLDGSEELHLQRTFEIYRKNYTAEVFLEKNDKLIFNSTIIY